MTKASFPSDTVTLKDISTGGNSAGNGGDGYNKGDISNSPSISFEPYNKAEGADVHVNTGDKVHQTADWRPEGPTRRRIGLPRLMAAPPLRTAARTPTAAITNPTWMPAQRPIRPISSPRT